MATEIVEILELAEGRNVIEGVLREELETAWLRGWVGRGEWNATVPTEEERDRMAADYAERVVGGSTRPERPHGEERRYEEDER